MEYKDIFLLQNPYPSIANYDGLPNSNIVLSGVYPQNSIEFNVPPFESLEIIDDTTFKFVLEIKDSAINNESRYFISPLFYSDLQQSKFENNPYHIQTALEASMYVKVSLDRQINLFNELKLLDIGSGVKQKQNIFILADNTIDYKTLVQYIDWVVSKPNPLDDETNGVIPAEKISDFEIGTYDTKTGEFISLKDKAVALQIRLDTLYEELGVLEETISSMLEDIPAEPEKRKTKILDGIAMGLGASALLKGSEAAFKGLSASKKVGESLTGQLAGKFDIKSVGESAKKQTDLVKKSIAQSDTANKGKSIANTTVGKVAGGFAKLIGVMSGPIGWATLFLIGNSKAKKQYQKEKAEFDRVQSELERLTKRKEDIEVEINAITKSGRLKILQTSTDKSSTQKYFENIGKSLIENPPTTRSLNTQAQNTNSTTNNTPPPKGEINIPPSQPRQPFNPRTQLSSTSNISSPERPMRGDIGYR